MSTNVGGIEYTLTMDTAGLIAGERKARQSLQKVGDEGDKLQSRMSGIAAAISAAISAIAIDGLVSKIVAAQRQFDVLFASLKTMTGGTEQATAAWERLVEFAAQTPYSLEQAVQGFAKLKALGLDPSERAMTSFGNTAAAMGKDLMQMIEAVADASTGEFERLKEFGIKSKAEGDKVTFTFQNVKTTVQNNAQAITEYLTKIGEVNFGGAMSERMKTLDGDISNLQDSMQALYLSIAQSGFGDAIAQGVRAATEAIQQATTSIKEGELTEYFATLKEYSGLAEVAVVSLAGAIAGRLVAALAASAAQAYATAAAMGAATVATRGFSAALSLLGGPIGIAITALGLLALNWDKISGSAKSAAEISEESATRIAAAQKKASDRASKDLATQLSEAERGLKSVQDKLAQAQKPALYGSKASDSVIQGYQDKADAYLKSIADIKAAQASLGGGAGRGKINPELVKGPTATEPDKPKGSKKQPFDQIGYLAEMREQAASEYDKIDIVEQEALRKNNALLKRKEISTATHAEAVKLIGERAARERAELADKNLTDLIREIEDENHVREQAAREKAQREEEQARNRQVAMQAIADASGDPVERIRLEEKAKLKLLEEYRQRDLANEQVYQDAKNAIKKKADMDAWELQMRINIQSAQLMQSGADMALEILTKAGKERTALGKAFFLASKALAVAEIIMNTEVAASKVMQQTGLFGIPMATLVRAQGYASAGMVAGMAVADAVGGRAYGGPVSADSLYRVNEKGAPEMFTAANGSQYMMPTTNGRVTAADKIGGGAPSVNIVVNNTAPGTVASASYDDQSRTVSIAVTEVANQIRTNTGPVWSAMRGATNVQARM